ncbi:LacI family DNA-binding transcriptional regulator [Cellulomonas edaphi]|uniref:LacI family DNA-binding transcriptional regulator n=1 Tax=Cellulomonas edaphi TaxID=3053468 RepID=A0ABT7S8M3_9CELL|nr:LacI family DNA-binding transcriptional regulator [Cellulomons edaphi]MDM7831972.1 LacI family DNA-binding transcriptional regulator [Cellulomons edaphi]
MTLQTIADQVGVSRMTVSNAFSRPDQLSSELRERVLAAAEALGYAGPDPAARVHARGTTGAGGVLLTESVGTAFQDPIAAAFFGAVAEELAPTGLAVALLPSTGSAEMVPARDIPMDGAMVYACAGDRMAVTYLLRRRLPLVFVDEDPVGDASSVLLDDRPGAAAAAQHLLDLGHRRIGILTTGFGLPPGVAPDPMDAGTGYVSRERVAGWMSVLGPAGVDVTVVHITDNSEAHADQGIRTLLALPDRPTAVLCFSDLVAWTVEQVAREQGLRVPDDLSVVGYDDSPVARNAQPQLTTVRQDLAAKGQAAASVLTRAIARSRGEAGAPTGPEHVLVPTELVVRASTGPAPAEA